METQRISSLDPYHPSTSARKRVECNLGVTISRREWKISMYVARHNRKMYWLWQGIWYIFLFITYRWWGRSTSYSIAHPACSHKVSTHLSPFWSWCKSSLPSPRQPMVELSVLPYLTDCLWAPHIILCQVLHKNVSRDIMGGEGHPHLISVYSQ